MPLVLVPCHAVCVTPEADDPSADAAWTLQAFQRGEPPCYIEHIRRAVEIAAQATDARLIFSGGMTRVEAGPVSEAESYRRVAERFGWWGFAGVAERAATEDFARDSFENLHFGIFRFRELTGRLPVRVTVVSWAFKRERFDLHRAAVGFPADRFDYLGVNDPESLADALAGEAKTIELFKADPRGETGLLAEKRRQRNPFGRVAPYVQSSPR